MSKYLVWRESWRSGSLGGLYKIEILHDGEEYEVFGEAPCEDWVTIGIAGPDQRTIDPTTGEERFVSAHILVFDYIENEQSVKVRSQKNILMGEFVELFHIQHEARRLQGRLTRVAEVMDS